MDNTITLPMLPLRGIVAFPYTVLNLEVARPASMRSVDEAMKKDRLIFLASQKDMRVEEPSVKDVYDIGVIARVRHVLRQNNGELMRVLVEGVARARLIYMSYEDAYYAEVSQVEQHMPYDDTSKAYMRVLVDSYEKYGEVTKNVPKEAVIALREIESPEKLADTVALNMVSGVELKQEMLEKLNVEDRFKRLIEYINEEINISKLSEEISQKTRRQLEKMQKEAYLREQMRAIQNTLGEGDEADEAGVFEQKVKALDVKDETKQKLLREVARFKRLSPTMPDHSVSRTYLETVTSLPFGVYTQDDLDLSHARRILDKDHFGMEKVKDRIIEFLAVKQLKPDMKEGNVICFVGPPGVGKTSVAHSIAHALNRKFVRMSLGGVHDEAEIRGHRRTYVGAIPGRIVSNIKKAGSMNPVFLLDEIDKMSNDFRGDPSSAMLEVLDPSINSTFADNYLDIEFDLSAVMFITTANDASSIPAPLYDRMEIIELSGYTEYEKLNIAKKHIIPKQLDKYGLNSGIVRFEAQAIKEIINSYTQESGVRTLERRIASVIRKAAAEYLSGKKRITVTKKSLKKYLGLAAHNESAIAREPQTGVVTGLAWTSAGGCTMPVEVITMPGQGALELTGNLGDVMKESAKAALSLIRSRGEELGIAADFFKNSDIHLHVPEGAVPKDGPSAGITITTAMVSAFTGKMVRSDIAMTGEITLRGKVLPIGGLKEKSLAALREGIKDIIIPKDNLRDTEEIPEEILSQLNFIPVSDISEVLGNALIK